MRPPVLLLLFALSAGVIAGALAARWYEARDESAPVVIHDLVAGDSMPDVVAEEHRRENFRTLDSVAAIVALPTAFARREALTVLAGRSDAAAVQGHIFAAVRIADEVEREHALNVLFHRLAELDPPSALALARTEPFRPMRSIENGVWSAWARKDFEGALFAAKTETSAAAQNNAAQALYAAFGSMGNETTDRIEAELGIGPDRAQRASYLYRLADRSPEAAIDYINAMPAGTEKTWNVNWLAYYLSLRDAEDAPKYAARFESANERRQFESVLVAESAWENPRPVLDRLLASRDGLENAYELNSAVRALAESDPEAAMEYFRSIRNPQTRQLYGSTLVSALAATDPEAALAWARENAQGGVSHNPFEMTAMLILAEHDPQLALEEALGSRNVYQRENLVSGVVNQVAQNNVEAAISLVRGIDDPQLQESAELHLAQALMSRDSDAALNWLEAMDEGQAQELLDQTGMILVHTNVDAAIRLLPRVSDGHKHIWVSQIAVQLVQTQSPDDALAFIRQFESDPNYASLQTEIIGSIAATDLGRARQLADQMGDPASRDDAYRQIAMYQAMESPSDALQTAEQIADPHVRAQATANAIGSLSRQDPVSARRMLAGMPSGPDRDQVVVQVLSDWSNMENMESLIDTIDNPELRAHAKASRVYYLFQKEPGRARALLDDPDINAEMRAELEALFEVGGIIVD